MGRPCPPEPAPHWHGPPRRQRVGGGVRTPGWGRGDTGRGSGTESLPQAAGSGAPPSGAQGVPAAGARGPEQAAGWLRPGQPSRMGIHRPLPTPLPGVLADLEVLFFGEGMA